MNYSWLQLSTAVAQLSQRLSDPGNVFWTHDELVLYLQQALRMFNVLTNTWKSDFVFNPTQLWNSLATTTNSPRQRTLTDTYCYTQMQYMLLEPPSGGTWTGTPQFNMTQFAQALQARRDEMIEISNCNLTVDSAIPLTPNTRRTILPDSVIEVARVRYLPGGAVVGSFGFGEGGFGEGGYGGYGGGGSQYPPVTLYRDDRAALEFYEPGFLQATPNTPQAFMLSSEPPLSFDVDIPPSYPGTYEAVELISGLPFTPPSVALLNIPDDFAWVLTYGALSDLLGRESEATDRQRADHCMKRYMDGLNVLLKSPWIMLASIDRVPVNTDSIAAMDRYLPEWDSSPTTVPVIVTGGIDFFAAPTGGVSVGMTVLANAPVPVVDADYVQVSRSNWDTVLDLAQFMACFKMGGADFQGAMEIEARAIRACAAENTRLKSTGAFSDILLQRGQAEDRDQERYATANAETSRRA